MIHTRFPLVLLTILLFICVGVTADPPLPADRAEEKIRNQLGDPQKGATSNDPILDDVLQIIRRQGSVLDGSSLDQANELPDSMSVGEDVVTSPVLLSEAAETAEALLRAARLLERTATSHAEQADLVLRMRITALRLLEEKLEARSIDAK